MRRQSPENFMRHVSQEADGCWIWQAKLRPDGYGAARIDGRYTTAHRVSHLLFIGPIPQGFEVDHLCRVRACVNPAHLEAVSREENVARGVAARTHCKNGHEFTLENTRWSSTRRYCRACSRQWTAAYKKRRAAA